MEPKSVNLALSSVLTTAVGTSSSDAGAASEVDFGEVISAKQDASERNPDQDPNKTSGDESSVGIGKADGKDVSGVLPTPIILKIFQPKKIIENLKNNEDEKLSTAPSTVAQVTREIAGDIALTQGISGNSAAVASSVFTSRMGKLVDGPVDLTEDAPVEKVKLALETSDNGAEFTAALNMPDSEAKLVVPVSAGLVSGPTVASVDLKLASTSPVFADPDLPPGEALIDPSAALTTPVFADPDLPPGATLLDPEANSTIPIRVPRAVEEASKADEDAKAERDTKLVQQSFLTSVPLDPEAEGTEPKKILTKESVAFDELVVSVSASDEDAEKVLKEHDKLSTESLQTQAKVDEDTAISLNNSPMTPAVPEIVKVQSAEVKNVTDSPSKTELLRPTYSESKDKMPVQQVVVKPELIKAQAVTRNATRLAGQSKQAAAPAETVVLKDTAVVGPNDKAPGKPKVEMSAAQQKLVETSNSLKAEPLAREVKKPAAMQSAASQVAMAKQTNDVSMQATSVQAVMTKEMKRNLDRVTEDKKILGETVNGKPKKAAAQTLPQRTAPAIEQKPRSVKFEAPAQVSTESDRVASEMLPSSNVGSAKSPTGSAASTNATPQSQHLSGLERWSNSIIDVQKQGWTQSLVRRVAAMPTNGGRLVITLQPASLGRITVSVSESRKGMDIRLRTETSATASLLNNAGGRISELLESSGMQLNSFFAETGGAFAENNNGASGSNADDRKDGQNHSNSAQDLLEDTEQSTVQRGDGLVNLIA